MDWPTFQLARQLLGEERVGRRLRAPMDAEDAAFEAAKEALRG